MGTKQVEVFRVCDICTTETRATETNHIALNGDAYEVDVCSKHDDALTAAVMRFAEKGTQTKKASLFFGKPKPPTTTVVPIRRATPVHHTETRPQREELPRTALSWTLSEHAKQRRTLRGFDIYTVLMTAERPANTHPGNRGDRVVSHFRADLDCQVVVDPANRTVLTVKRLSLLGPSMTQPKVATR